MVDVSLCLVHLGNHRCPNYLLDTVYQAIVYHNISILNRDDHLTIYVLVERENMFSMKKYTDLFNVSENNQISLKYIPIDSLKKSKSLI
jgi:hypothetical protein